MLLVHCAGREREARLGPGAYAVKAIGSLQRCFLGQAQVDPGSSVPVPEEARDLELRISRTR